MVLYTWIDTEISVKSQRLTVSTIDNNAVGLGDDILYQSYFVCVKETSKSTIIEYGKSLGTAKGGDVYLTMIDQTDSLQVRFYAFGNGEHPLEIADAKIVSRQLIQAECKGDTSLDEKENMCIQKCNELCDPLEG